MSRIKTKDTKVFATKEHRQAIIDTIIKRINTINPDMSDTFVQMTANKDKVPMLVDYILTLKPYATYSGADGWNNNEKGCYITEIRPFDGEIIRGVENIIAYEKTIYTDFELIVEKTAHNIYCEMSRYYRMTHLMGLKHENRKFKEILQ